MTMREKLALAVAKAYRPHDAAWTEERWSEALERYKALPADERGRWRGVHLPLSAVDAMLAALAEPSETVIRTAYGMSDLCVSECFDAVEQMRLAWRIGIQAIREGE